MRRVRRVILHYSASDYSRQTAKWIDRIHRTQRGFVNGIGYHYFIRTDGLIEMGRPIHEVGAHCKGKNTGSIGVCLAGGAPTEAQLTSLRYVLLPILKVAFPDATLHGHREFVGTLCPAFDYGELVQYWYGSNEKERPF